MNDDSSESRYAVSDRPVNRRTAPPSWSEPAPASPEVLKRVQQMHSRHLLGVPLAEVIAAQADAPTQARVPASSIACVIAATAFLPVAALAGSWLFKMAAGVGAISLYATAWWAARRAHRQWAAQQSLPMPSNAPGVDPRALQALDDVLDAVSTELPGELFQQLLALKNALGRAVKAARSAGVSEYCTMEDHMYLHECIRRYLPDSLLAYLRVPAGKRGDALGDEGVSAVQALSNQLALIQAELDRLEGKIAASAGQALLLQQRFLQAKARRSP
jgi:hypothetical protein